MLVGLMINHITKLAAGWEECDGQGTAASSPPVIRLPIITITNFLAVLQRKNKRLIDLEPLTLSRLYTNG